MAQEIEKNNNNKSMAKFVFEKVSAKDLHISRYGGWLESRFHFRFSNWHPMDRTKYGFGVLHVLNDDLVKPSNGFGMHPHRDQEIFSYILDGHLTHTDSKGNKETLQRGSVQFMSAGKGVWHSEMNHDKNTTCHFLQTWIYPNQKDLNVQYGSHSFQLKDRHNTLLHMISGTKGSTKAPIQLSQDVNVYVSELDYNKTVEYQLKKGRQCYLVCPEGTLNINNVIDLETKAAVRLYGELLLNIKGTKKIDSSQPYEPSAHFMMIEMEQTEHL